MTLPPPRPRPPLGPRLLTVAALLLLVTGTGLTWRNAAPESASPLAAAGTRSQRGPHTAPLPAPAHPGPHEPSPGSGPPTPSDGGPLEASSLEGTVVDEAGRPVAGAQLYLYQTDPAQPGDLDPEERRTRVHSTHCGEDGTFLLEARRPGHTDGSGKALLEALEPGRRRVVAATPGDEPLRTVGAEVELVDGQRTSVVLRFSPGPRLSGVVVDGRGQPVAGAEVRAGPASLLESAFGEGELQPFSFRAHREWLSGSSWAWYTGANGRFTLTRLPPGPLVVSAYRSGYTLDEQATPGPVRKLEGKPGVLTGPGAGEVRLVMKALAHVRGRVVRADGSPVTRFAIDGDTYEDEQGAFRLAILRGGAAVLVFGAQGLASTRRELRFQEGVDVDMGEVVLEAGREVRLRVVDADTGLPVEGAFVDVRAPADAEAGMDTSLLYPYPAPAPWEREKMLLTGGDGVVRLPSVEEQPRVLRVEHCGYLGTRVPLGARQREFTVALRPGARVEGAVSVGGVVSGHGRVEVLTAEGEHAAFADIQEGRYRTCALEEGRYGLEVEGHVFEDRTMPSHVRRVVDLPARGTVTVDFDAPREGALVRVSAPSGRVDRLLLVPGALALPVTRAQLLEARARAYSPMYSLGGTKEGEGYRFRLIPPGLYTLLAVKDWRASPVELHVEELWVPEPGTVSHELQPRWQRGPDSLSAD